MQSLGAIMPSLAEAPYCNTNIVFQGVFLRGSDWHVVLHEFRTIDTLEHRCLAFWSVCCKSHSSCAAVLSELPGMF